MRKIFRLAKAELNKIFMRPSMFVLATVLIVALIFSFFFFSPEDNKVKHTYGNDSITNVYNNFKGNIVTFEDKLINAKTHIDNYLQNNNSYATFKTTIELFCNDYDNFYKLVVDNTQQGKDYKTPFKNFKTSTRELRDYLSSNIDGKYINFFITINQYNKIYTVVENLYEALPSELQLTEFTTQTARDRLSLIRDSFQDEITEIKNTTFNKLEEIKIDETELTKLLNQYYYSNMQDTSGGDRPQKIGTFAKLFSEIENYYLENAGNSAEEKVAILNEKIAQFCDYAQMCETLIINNFELLRIGNKTDDQIITYNGFSGVSIYNLKKDIATSKYFYDLNNDQDETNNSFGYEYLDVFNFRKNSGTATNAYDFTFFAMQILSSLIIIFVIFFAGTSITGEQNSGTLKMTATRPYSRNKIFSGKFLACFNVSLILLIVSFIASFAVGYATFGLTTQNVLVVMNASTVFVASPIVVLLIYFASLIVDILFYITLSILISMFIKPTTINTALSAGVFLLSTILSGTITDSWLRFIPTSHLGLFKYFTNSSTAIFSYSIVPGVNFTISGIIILVCLIMFNLIARMLFVRKSIDR